jgi:3',5'-nucleoside bisphosphate phosphatase
MLELHCHTTHSDGTLSPSALIRKAHHAGVKAIAITDHDTMAGWEEAIAAAKPFGLEVVPGIELSTVWNGRSLHILGFYPNPEKLRSPLQERIAGRWRRAQSMVDKLRELGYSIDLPRSGTLTPGRPHIAKALVNAGYVKTPQDAFDRWLGEDRPAYVPYEKFTAIEGIHLLRECGAVPVWAHPYLFRGGVVADILPEFVEAGLMGLEVYHPSHSPHQQTKLQELCDRYDLLMTGGSDYHGPANPGEESYPDLNHFRIPYRLLTPLKQAAAH